MHKTESILENETHEIHWDLGIQTDLLILARRLVLVIMIKKEDPSNYGLHQTITKHWSEELAKNIIMIHVLLQKQKMNK